MYPYPSPSPGTTPYSSFPYPSPSPSPSPASDWLSSWKTDTPSRYDTRHTYTQPIISPIPRLDLHDTTHTNISSMVGTTDLAKIRILVVGDSGCGKSSFVHRLCHDTTWNNPTWTVGCQSQVKLHEYHRQGQHRQIFIEFFDVGGHRKFKTSREIFYTQINGILLLFDLSNRKSYEHLRKWIRELVRVDRIKGGIEEKYMTGEVRSISHPPRPSRPLPPPHTSTWSSTFSFLPSWLWFNKQRKHDDSDSDEDDESESEPSELTSIGVTETPTSSITTPPPTSSLGSLPVLVIGNKLDLINAKTRQYECMKDYGLDCIQLSSLTGGPQFAQLDAFFDKCIERRFYRSDVPRRATCYVTPPVQSMSSLSQIAVARRQHLHYT